MGRSLGRSSMMRSLLVCVARPSYKETPGWLTLLELPFVTRDVIQDKNEYPE